MNLDPFVVVHQFMEADGGIECVVVTIATVDAFKEKEKEKRTSESAVAPACPPIVGYIQLRKCKKCNYFV